MKLYSVCKASDPGVFYTVRAENAAQAEKLTRAKEWPRARLEVTDESDFYGDIQDILDGPPEVLGFGA